MSYTHPRTGRSWANEAMAIQMDGPLVNPAPGVVQVGEFARTTTGAIPGPTPIQQGSQFWMNSNYTGPEPTVAVKKAFSSAEYASAWIGNYAQGLKDIGVNVSPRVSEIASYAPVQTTQPMIELWRDVPAIAPQTAVQINYAPGDPPATASPTAYNNPNDANAPPSPVSGAGVGTVDPYQPVFPVVTPNLPALMPELADVPGVNGVASVAQTASDSLKSVGAGTVLIMVAVLAIMYFLFTGKGVKA